MPLANFTQKTRAGPGYIILNTIRVCNIIGLLAVITSSIVLVVKTFLGSQFIFFDGASHLVTVFASIFLIISELPVLKQYFLTHWPVLSPSHGFIALGLAMIAIGIDILGDLNKPATSKTALGVSIWRSVIGSGIIVFVLGFINIAVSFIFSNRTYAVTARQIRAKGAIAVTLAMADHPRGPPISLPTPIASDSMLKHPATTVFGSTSVTSSVDSSPASSYKSASVMEVGAGQERGGQEGAVKPPPVFELNKFWRFEPRSPVPSSYYSDRESGLFGGGGMAAAQGTANVTGNVILNGPSGYLVRPETAVQIGQK